MAPFLDEKIKISKRELLDSIRNYSETLLREVVEFDEMRISNELVKKIESVNLSDDETESDIDDNIHDQTLEVITSETEDKNEIKENDTFLYPVNQLSLEEKTLTNELAKIIVDNENNLTKNNTSDSDSPSENFLFKNIEDDCDDNNHHSTQIPSNVETTNHKENIKNMFKLKLSSKKSKKESKKDKIKFGEEKTELKSKLLTDILPLGRRKAKKKNQNTDNKKNNNAKEKGKNYCSSTWRRAKV